MEKLKLAARYLITLAAISVATSILAYVLDAHDFRLVIAAGLGMFLGQNVLDLTKKIPYIGE